MFKRHHILMAAIIWIVMGGTAAFSAGESSVVLTELMANAEGDDEIEEWFELANVGTAPVDISRYAVGDEEELGGVEGLGRFPAGTVLEPGQVILIAQTAAAFTERYGIVPDFEILESEAAVPNLEPAFDLATGEIRFSNAGDQLVLFDADESLIDGVSYGDKADVLSPPAMRVQKGQSLERIPANCDTDTADDWQSREFPTPGRIETEETCPESSNGSGTSPDGMPIGEIQGSSGRSPFAEQTIETTGIVIGTQADRNSAGVTYHTVYLQSPIGAEDGDPTTSDGLPIFLGIEEPGLEIGDEVFVRGRITEYYGLTEVEQEGITVQILSRGNPLPEPTVYDPTIERTEQEALEGTSVVLGEAIVIAPTYQTTASCGFTVMRPSEFEEFGETIITDYEQPLPPTVPVLHVDETDCESFPVVKTGDRISGLAGPLTYNFEIFRIVNQDPAGLTVTPGEFPELPDPPDLTESSISVTTFNVENFFDGEDDTGQDFEPKLSDAEIAVKQAKIAYAIGGLLECPTVVGIQEVEKASLLIGLAEELTEYCGFTYDVTHFESLDARGIDNALMTDPNRVTVDAAELLPTCSEVRTDTLGFDCPMGQFPLFSRPPLKAELTIDGTTDVVVFVNHFKSKRGGDTETLLRRKRQAEFVRSEVEALNGRHAIVLGDFNDYSDTSPMRVFAEDGFLTNVMLNVPEGKAYTFNFGGVRQLIDGILLTEGLNDQVSYVNIFHVNSDYPDAFTEDLSPERIMYKSSDHDPALVIIELSEDAPSQAEPAEDNSPVAETPSGGDGSSEDAPRTGIGGYVTLGIAGLLLVLAGWLTLRPRKPRE